tara:strand:+ start:117 stop:590 length:474 start_codon:yes stop_codon:yes gene_type:complete
MTTQAFNLYTANGYAGDLVDSGPRVIQTGILTSATAGFGLGMSRDASVERGVSLGGSANVFAISQREYNHEASVRPSTGDDTLYRQTESVSLIRQGYLYVKLSGAVAVAAGEFLHVDTSTGLFSKSSVAGNVVATTNVVADEAAIAGEVFKIRIDIK